MIAYKLGYPLRGLRNRLEKAGAWSSADEREAFSVTPAPAAEAARNSFFFWCLSGGDTPWRSTRQADGTALTGSVGLRTINGSGRTR